jgi:hypothetical protein
MIRQACDPIFSRELGPVHGIRDVTFRFENERHFRPSAFVPTTNAIDIDMRSCQASCRLSRRPRTAPGWNKVLDPLSRFLHNCTHLRFTRIVDLTRILGASEITDDALD